jgi:hypothetical protein
MKSPVLHRLIFTLSLTTLIPHVGAMNPPEGQPNPPAAQQQGFLRRNRMAGIGLGALLFGGLGYLLYRKRDKVKAVLGNVVQRFTGHKLSHAQAMELVDQELATLPADIPLPDRKKLRDEIDQALFNVCTQRRSDQMPEEEARQIITDRFTDFAHNYMEKEAALAAKQKAQQTAPQIEKTVAPEQPRGAVVRQYASCRR